MADTKTKTKDEEANEDLTPLEEEQRRQKSSVTDLAREQGMDDPDPEEK